MGLLMFRSQDFGCLGINLELFCQLITYFTYYCTKCTSIVLYWSGLGISENHIRI